ncbi:MAG TPA: 1-acyl-sn-glycerol-3-phosphate acyltransferase [Waddliaceae bacterium]
MDFINKLTLYTQEGKLPLEIFETLNRFYSSYVEAIQANQGEITKYIPLLNQFLDLAVEQLREPYIFGLYHQSIRSPFDFYRFGLEFIRPLIKLDASRIEGINHADEIMSYLASGDNVILFANHQTEPDPQAISLLLEKTHPKLAEEIIFIAGQRVVTDPLATPFSKGRNLLCIYSKNYIDHPPELKHQKLAHNQRTMKVMKKLLGEGRKCIYVAPSGGRDRLSSEGRLEVAPFDAQSVEMFRLMAEHSTQRTHFYPLALATFDLLPPPHTVQMSIGEPRHASCTPIHLAFGSEIDMHNIPGIDHSNKDMRRKLGTEHIWRRVCEEYQKIRRR